MKVAGLLRRGTGDGEQCHAGVCKLFLSFHHVRRRWRQRFAAFAVHKSAFSQAWAETLQGWQQQAGIVGRVHERDVPELSILRQEFEHADRKDGETRISELRSVLAQACCSFVVVFDQSCLQGPTGLRFKTERPAAGVKVQTAPALDTPGEPVEKGDPGPLQSRSYGAISREAELSTLPLPTDNARLVVQTAVP